jgi:hypothetical protein
LSRTSEGEGEGEGEEFTEETAVEESYKLYTLLLHGYVCIVGKTNLHPLFILLLYLLSLALAPAPAPLNLGRLCAEVDA